MPGPTIEDVLARLDLLETTLLNRLDALEWKKEEYADSDGFGSVAVYGNNIRAQTFVPKHTHAIAYVRLKICRQGSPGNVVVSLKATDTLGKPTGDSLFSVIINGNLFGTDNANWEICIFDPRPLVEKNTKYALVIAAPNGNANNFLVWTIDSTGTSYLNGQEVKSLDGGITWSLMTSDLIFEEWQNRIDAIEKIELKLESGEIKVYTESAHAR